MLKLLSRMKSLINLYQIIVWDQYICVKLYNFRTLLKHLPYSSYTLLSTSNTSMKCLHRRKNGRAGAINWYHPENKYSFFPFLSNRQLRYSFKYDWVLIWPALYHMAGIQPINTRQQQNNYRREMDCLHELTWPDKLHQDNPQGHMTVPIIDKRHRTVIYLYMYM